MDMLNSVSAGTQVVTDVYSQGKKVKSNPEDILFPQTKDIVEISPEAKEAQKKAEEDVQKMERAMDRADNLMRIRGLKDEEIKEFRGILKDYQQSGKDAKSYLKSLDFNQRDLVKRATSYGTRFADADIDSWSDEGAENMLRDQDWRFAIDLNNDGMVDHGAAKTFVFPPVGAPDEVKDAWETMSKDMSEQDRLLFPFRFMPMNIENVVEKATVSGFDLSRGFPKDTEGWMDMIDHIFEAEEYNSKTSPDTNSREMSKKMMKHLTEFKRLVKEEINK